MTNIGFLSILITWLHITFGTHEWDMNLLIFPYFSESIVSLIVVELFYF